MGQAKGYVRKDSIEILVSDYTNWVAKDHRDEQKQGHEYIYIFPVKFYREHCILGRGVILKDMEMVKICEGEDVSCFVFFPSVKYVIL